MNSVVTLTKALICILRPTLHPLPLLDLPEVFQNSFMGNKLHLMADYGFWNQTEPAVFVVRMLSN